MFVELDKEKDNHPSAVQRPPSVGEAVHLPQFTMACGMSLFSGLIKRSRVFQGGVYLPPDLVSSAYEPVREIAPPAKLVVPLLQHEGVAAEPIVEIGQAVQAGELIGKATRPDAMNIHAPAAGKVTGLVQAATARHVSVQAVKLEIQEDLTSPLSKERQGGKDLDTAALADIADRAGIVNCRRPVIALGNQLRRASRHEIHDLIINGLPPEPLVTAGCELLRRHTETVVEMCVQLAAILQADRVWIAIDRSDRDLAVKCQQAIRKTSIRIAAMHNKYPQAAPSLLVWAITGRETPIGRRSEHVHCVVLEVAPLLDLAVATQTGQPMVDRVVNVAGPAVAQPGLYRISIGTAVAEVLRQVGLSRTVAQVIEGGPLTGTALKTTETIITRQTSALLVLDYEHERVPAPGPCIRCGWCQDTCPVGLDPQALLDAAERGDISTARTLHPGACLMCGLCSYICPAELPLSQTASRMRLLGQAIY